MKLPHALVIGAAKSGTTSLRMSLRSHPLICESGIDDYFEHWWVENGRNDEFYAERFTKCKKNVECFIDTACSYMQFPYVFERMAEVIPDAKLLILLRDPVMRAFSHYNMFFYPRRAEFKKSFQEIIDDCMLQLPIKFDSMSSEREEEIKDNIVYRGIYVDQLEAIFQRWPQEQIHIEITERFKNDCKGTIERVLNFLGLELHNRMKFKPCGVGAYGGRMLPHDQANRLRRFYTSYNDRLRELLQDDLPEWNIGV